MTQFLIELIFLIMRGRSLEQTILDSYQLTDWVREDESALYEVRNMVQQFRAEPLLGVLWLLAYNRSADTVFQTHNNHSRVRLLMSALDQLAAEYKTITYPDGFQQELDFMNKHLIPDTIDELRWRGFDAVIIKDFSAFIRHSVRIADTLEPNQHINKSKLCHALLTAQKQGTSV